MKQPFSPTFFTRLNQWLDQINVAIKDELDRIYKQAPSQNHPLISRVYKSVYAYLDNGGKRLHSIPIILSYLSTGGERVEDILPLCSAIQLYHHHTLVHDDIYDEDLKRRGSPTIHQAFYDFFNEKDTKEKVPTTLFVNDARRKGAIAAWAQGKIVHALVFECLYQLDISAEQRLEVIRLLNLHDIHDNAAQLKDVYHEGQKIPSPQACLDIVYEKTGKLYEVGINCALIASGASEKEVQALKLWGRNIAIAYQLEDDLQDLYADSEKGKGRGVGADLYKAKPTFILATALELASEEEREQLKRWIAGETKGLTIEKIIGILFSSGAVNLCVEKIKKLIHDGLEEIKVNVSLTEDMASLFRDISYYSISDDYWRRVLPGVKYPFDL